MKLSENFYLHEFLRSQTATRMGRDIEAPDWVIGNLRALCENVLQPIRDHFTKNIDPDIRIYVSSGYRPEWLNKRIGGSKNSQHMKGQAADFGLIGGPDEFGLYEASSEIAEFCAAYDQLIFEQSWIHISHSPFCRQQILSAEFRKTMFGRKTIYHNGLVQFA